MLLFLRRRVKAISILSILSSSVVLIFFLSISSSYARHTTTHAGDPANGIVSSRHNLSDAGWPFAGPTSEICVYCHTPHWAGGGAPLWNRKNSVTSFTGENGSFTPNAGSLACLSCHDGQTAFDALINRPGHGSNTDGSATDLQWAFWMPAASQSYPTTDYDHLGTDTTAPCDICHKSGSLFADWVDPGRLVIGTNLTDDHPISVEYKPGVHSLRPTSTLLGSIDLTTSTGGAPLVTGNLWSIEGNIQDDGKIQDLLEGPNNTVECVSCHDPHYKNQTNPDQDFVGSYFKFTQTGLEGRHPTTKSLGQPATSHTDRSIDGLFLRRVGGNSDSGVCRTCHDK